jgi:hypothetical protein
VRSCRGGPIWEESLEAEARDDLAGTHATCHSMSLHIDISKSPDVVPSVLVVRVAEALVEVGSGTAPMLLIKNPK